MKRRDAIDYDPEPKHYIKSLNERTPHIPETCFTYRPSIIEIRFIVFDKPEHSRQFEDLLKAAGYKEQETPNED